MASFDMTILPWLFLTVFALFTTVYGAPFPIIARQTDSSGALKITFTNNAGGSYKAWITGLADGGTLVMVNSDNTWIYPQPNQAIPSTAAIPVDKGVIVPGYLQSARIFVAASDLNFTVGTSGLNEPSPGTTGDTDWGFVEFTSQPSKVWANIAYVDFVGLPLGLAAGSEAAQGAVSGAVDQICSTLKAQEAKDQTPWGSLCVPESGVKRVLSPTQGSGFDTYWDDYIEEVWKTYSTKPLNIDTQGNGKVSCQVSGDELTCNGGDNRGYPKPKSADVWGCHTRTFERRADDSAVHLAVIPRLCAAFHRGTLLIDGGDSQPVDQKLFYSDTSKAMNWYCKAVKEAESDGRGYCFPYDDVHLDGQETAGVVTSASTADGLTITIGGTKGTGGGSGGGGGGGQAASPGSTDTSGTTGTTGTTGVTGAADTTGNTATTATVGTAGTTGTLMEQDTPPDTTTSAPTTTSSPAAPQANEAKARRVRKDFTG